MKRTLILASLLLTSSCFTLQSIQAISQETIVKIACVASGPTAFGLWKLGQFIYRSKPAQKIAKPIAKGIAKGIASVASADIALTYASKAADSYLYRQEQRRWYAVFSFVFGLGSSILAHSAINDLKQK